MAGELTQAPLTIESIDVGTAVNGKVTYLGVYGAMVDIGLGRDALLHISQVGQSNFKNLEEVMKIGDDIEAYVLKVDQDHRIALTTEKPPELQWGNIKTGATFEGTVTRIEDYGAFVDIGAERPGMVHVSELADGFVQSPSDVVNVGDRVTVRVIKLNRRNRQIDLSMKMAAEEVEEVLEPDEAVPSAMELAFLRAQKQADNNRKRSKKDRKLNEAQDDILTRTLRDHSS